MPMIEDRLRRAASEIRDRASNAEVPALAAPDHRQSQLSGWAVATVAALLLVVTIGGVTWALRDPSVNIVDEPAGSTGVEIESLIWTRAPIAGEAFDMGDVIAGGPGYIAVGGEGIWVSSDGAMWTQVQSEGLGYPYLSEGSVTIGGPGLVAAGVNVSGNGSEVRATVWTSSDGLEWSRIPNEAESFALGTGIRSVTAGGPGLVAVGWAPAQAGGIEVNPAVWTSRDGLAWSRVPHDEQVFGSAESLGAIGGTATRIHSVTAGGPGLVAVGMAGRDAAVWTSPDGFSWSRVPHDEYVFGSGLTSDDYQAMWNVVAGGPGVVAIGEEEKVEGAATHVAVWTSPDGISWSRVPHDDTLFGFGTYRGDGKVIMRSIAAVDTGLVAVGGQGLFVVAEDASVATDIAVVWTSPDGVTWSRTANDDEILSWAEMTHVVAESDGLKAFGFAGREFWSPTLWEAFAGVEGSGVNN